MLLLFRPYTDENGHVDDKLLDDLTEEERALVLAWVKRYIKPRAYVNHHYTSYSLKHLFQHDTGIYLTNNQFKDAMIECGFFPENPDALNWKYKISEEWLKKRNSNKN